MLIWLHFAVLRLQSARVGPTPVANRSLALNAPELLDGVPAAAVEHRRQAFSALCQIIARLTVESASETRGVPTSVAQRRFVRMEVFKAAAYLRLFISSVSPHSSVCRRTCTQVYSPCTEEGPLAG